MLIFKPGLPSRILTLLLVATVGLAGTGFGPPALVDLDARAWLTRHQVAAASAAAPPATSARAFAILDGSTGRLLASHQADLPVAPASTTKIVTAIVTLERARLDDWVDIDVSATDMLGSSVMGLHHGEKLTVEDLLYGLMLPSGNDAALALARHVGGTEEEFVRLMNDKVRELGLQNTHFVNPHGLDADGHYSSAADLAHLARYAARNPTFNRIIRTGAADITGQWVYHLQNTNLLLGQRLDVDGVKTGTTDAAGRCLVLSATQNGRRVFISLLNAPQLYEDALRLLDYTFATFGWHRAELQPSPLYQQRGEDNWLRPLQLWDAPEVCLAGWETVYLWWLALRWPTLSSWPLEGVPVVYFLGDAQLGTGSLNTALPASHNSDSKR